MRRGSPKGALVALTRSSRRWDNGKWLPGGTTTTRRHVGFTVIGLYLAGPLGATVADAALINAVSQTRTISAYVEGYDPPNWISDSQSDSATDFGLFDSSVTAQIDISLGTVLSSAQQRSGGCPKAC